MSVKIRLRRVGRKKQPSYRIVVADVHSPRDGQYLDTVGFYNPRTKPAELRLDLVKIDSWIKEGAELSDTAASLVRKARKGGDPSVQIREIGAASMTISAPKTVKPRGKKSKAAAGEGAAVETAPEA